MRVLLAPVGTLGDVQPLLVLGSRLRAEGHDVALCAHTDFEGDAQAFGVAFHSLGESLAEHKRELGDAYDKGGLRPHLVALRHARASMRATFRVFPDLVRDYDLVLGAGLQHGARAAAERHKIPYKYIVYCPIMVAFDPHWLPRTIAKMMLWASHRMLGPELNRLRTGLGLPAVDDITLHTIGPEPVLSADAALAPLPDKVVGVTHVPAWLPPPQPLSPELTSFLAAGPKPIYVGFGSMPTQEARSLSAVLRSALRERGLRGILSQGWAGLGEGETSDDQCLIVGSCSHTALFPQVTAVVHHGGAGTTTAAARSGVPQVIVPHGADQGYWSARAHSLGVAPAGLPRTSLRSPRDLVTKIAQVLDEPSYAASATELATRLEKRDESLSWLTRGHSSSRSDASRSSARS